MLIKRIKATNYKTYLNLNLDLDVSEDSENRTIILIGGENGGGKTTLFEAIYGSLYGLQIKSAQDFIELVNASLPKPETEKIVLELHFSGMVLNEEKQYILTRTYLLNPEKRVIESVKLNMDGNIFSYGTATAAKERMESEAQVSKIIKANLPQELSRYFLFDAMESGNLLAKDQLRKVIKENIENVMGFNKYIQLAQASEILTQDFTALRLEREALQKEYREVTNQKRELEKLLETYKDELERAIDYSIKEKQLYIDTKNGLNHETTIKNKIQQIENEIKNIKIREENYKKDADVFAKNIHTHIALPQLASALKNQISLILKETSESEYMNKRRLDDEIIHELTDHLIVFLSGKGIGADVLKANDLQLFLKSLNEKQGIDRFDFLDNTEIQALSNLVNTFYNNPYPSLHQQKNELDTALRTIPKLRNQIEDYKKDIAGIDFDILKKYEANEQLIKTLQQKIDNTKLDLKKIENRLAAFDISTNEEPDPKFELLKKLKPFFENLSDKLLVSKKKSLEMRMKKDLNINLAAYQDVIEKVELSENLKDLSFKIFHRAGNEIYLNTLNTASKQVVVQVLLKALHEYGDYDPPVMIDTVMGVLDERSRETLLENYFPQLSHQTILFSTDSEIRKKSDFNKIQAFVAKSYTLIRNKELQQTAVTQGYFGLTIENIE